MAMAKLKEVYNAEKCAEVTTYVSTSYQAKAPSLAEKYYDLVTDFFEFGWGKSFHFAPQSRSETMEEALLKHELKIAEVLQLRPGMRVLDVGCGVGGPMKNIAQKSGANITGLNINAYQIEKAKAYIAQHGLASLCSFVQGNFMHTGLPDASFDAIYAIESTMHAPDKSTCFKELHRLLKPGGKFAGYEYCLLDAYDPKQPEHVQIIEDLEHGGGLQKTLPIPAIRKSFVEAGFQVLALHDVCTEGLSWTLPLENGLKSSKLARSLTHYFVRMLEFLHLAPQGSSLVSSFLNLGADAFVKAGQKKLFAANLFFLVQK